VAEGGRFELFGLAVALAVIVIGLATIANAADDTARFCGQWKTSFPFNGQTVTMISIRDQDGYHDYVVTPAGNQPAGDGSFSGANGKWSSSATGPNNEGTYHFLNANTVVCTNYAGQTATWGRDKTALTCIATSLAPVSDNRRHRRNSHDPLAHKIRFTLGESCLRIHRQYDCQA
jgi:hypothetical protein